MFRLMIKTHNVTGLKYLCITKRDDWERYSGSGIYWKRHLKKYGYDFSTELLYESNDYNDFLEKCAYYSIYYNVVLDDSFANLKPENGYDDLVLYWKFLTEEEKNNIYKKRAKTLKKYWENIDDEKVKERGRKISNSLKRFNSLADDDLKEKQKENGKKLWVFMTIEERRESLDRMHQGFKRFCKERGDSYEKWKASIKETMNNYWANIPDEKKREIGEKISVARLNLSKEKKEIRKQKILAWHDSVAEDRKKIYEKYSRERRGINNPNAKNVLWDGEVRLLKDVFKEFGKSYVLNKLDEGLDRFKYLFDRSIKKDYGVLECRYCGYIKPSDKQPGSFLRWHGEKCKKRNLL